MDGVGVAVLGADGRRANPGRKRLVLFGKPITAGCSGASRD